MGTPAPPCAASPNAQYSVRAGGATAAEVRLPTTSWVDARQMMTARASDTQTPRSLSVSKSEAPDGAMAALFGSTRSPPLGSARLPAAPLVSPRCRSAPSGAARRPLGAARRRLAPLGRTPAGRLLAQRPRRCRGGGELPVAKTRLTVQDGGSRPRPCTSVPLQSRLPPRYRGRGALFDLGSYLPPGGRRRRCRAAAARLSLIHI